MRIIGIAGKKQAGKDTLANMLVERGYTRYGFADPIKEMLKTMFLWSDYDMNDSKAKEIIDPIWGISPRQAMQNLGIEFGQYDLPKAFPIFEEMTGRSIWVKRFTILVGAHPEIDKWVIPDVRFPHEVELLKEMGAEIIRMDRDQANEVLDGHESEIHADEMLVDAVIDNNGTIDDLWESVERLCHARS